MSTLHLLDAETAADLRTYLGRAANLGEDVAVRLQADDRALAAWIGVLEGRGVTRSGTVLGLRAFALAESGHLDQTVPVRAVLDRLARPGATNQLPLPPMTLSPGWAAVSPPRSGWRQMGSASIADLREAASAGIAEIAEGAPEGSRAAAVADLRHRVWTRALPTAGAADGLPAGVGFAAHALGFLTGDQATVFGAGRWYRVSTPAGHVLVR